jgi:hypothetical protein
VEQPIAELNSLSRLSFTVGSAQLFWWCVGVAHGRRRWVAVAALLIGVALPSSLIVIMRTNDKPLAPGRDLGAAETRILLTRRGNSMRSRGARRSGRGALSVVAAGGVTSNTQWRIIDDVGTSVTIRQAVRVRHEEEIFRVHAGRRATLVCWA